MAENAVAKNIEAKLKKRIVRFIDLIFGLRTKYKQNWPPPLTFGLFSGLIVMRIFTECSTKFFI